RSEWCVPLGWSSVHGLTRAQKQLEGRDAAELANDLRAHLPAWHHCPHSPIAKLPLLNFSRGQGDYLFVPMVAPDPRKGRFYCSPAAFQDLHKVRRRVQKEPRDGGTRVVLGCGGRDRLSVCETHAASDAAPIDELAKHMRKDVIIRRHV